MVDPQPAPLGKSLPGGLAAVGEAHGSPLSRAFIPSQRRPSPHRSPRHRGVVDSIRFAIRDRGG